MRSFINFILPKDEYQRLRVLYFIAEVAVILAIGSAVISILDILFFDWDLWTLWLIPWLIGMYVFYRYIFSGLEYTDISSEHQYKKRKRKSLITAIATAIMFFLVSMLMSGGFTNKEIAIDKIGITLTFFIFFYLFDQISLRRSYRKNKDFHDD